MEGHKFYNKYHWADTTGFSGNIIMESQQDRYTTIISRIDDKN